MAEDRSWVNAIVKWSDQFNLGLPKTYDELINLKEIGVSYYDFSLFKLKIK